MPGDAIVVTGSIVASQQASVEAKRKAINMTDVASADAAARFPDQSAAGALARLPGVAVQRDQGQERYIQVRGAPNRWTSVSIDGVPMVGVDEDGNTRAFRFDAIPAVMLSEMVINKSLTSNLQADAIVATIDLKTYSPFDRRGFHVDGDAGYGFMGHGGGQQRQGSLRVSWSNDTVGIVLGGSHYLRDQITDNREPGYNDKTGEPRTFSVRSYKLRRYNNGLFGGIEWSPEAGQKLYAKVIWSEFADNEERNHYDFAVSGNAVTGINAKFNDGKYRNRNTIGLIGGDYDNFNGFTASFKANYAKTVYTTDLPLVRSSITGLGDITYTLSDPRFPVFSDNDGSFSQTMSQAGTILLPIEQRIESDSYTIKFDIAKELGDLTLSAGLLYADRDISGNVLSIGSPVTIGKAGSRIGQPFNINDYVTSTRWDTDYPLGLSLNYVDNKAMRKGAETTLAAMEAAGLFDPSAVIKDTSRYNQQERTLAGYFMGTLVKGPLTVAGGVRIEKYSMNNAGWLGIGGADTPKTYSSDKTDLFPSLNIRYEASNDIILRLAGQRGVSRPAYGATRVGASVNDTSTPGEIKGGNPLLKPEYTWGVDTSFEWYLPGNGMIAVGAFYRWVDNVLYNTPGIDRSNYLFSGQYNGKSGKLYGIEFNVQKQFDFLPGALSGFGVQGNLTLLDGDFKVYADLANLTNETYVAYAGTLAHPTEVERIGSRYLFGVRFSY
ncbi:MAG: TonB-dependent receptor [Novosphingobium sp.]